MDITADIARLPGIAPGEAISGGIAAGPWSAAGSNACLLYRHTAQLLEVRAMEMAALEVPEALATLSTAQLQVNAVEDLEIALVKPVVLNGVTQLLVFLRETLTQVGRVCTFNPFTLGIHHISATVPYSPSSISVSAPFCAGQGSSTEWEFAIVCFGLASGRALVGNLTIGPGGSQLTALKTCALGKHKCGVTETCVLQRPDASGRALIVFGLESGHAVALEYDPFNGGRATHVCTVSEGADLGPVSCVAGAVLDDRQLALCTGHNASSRDHPAVAVSAYVIALDSADSAGSGATVTHIDTVAMDPMPDEADTNGDGASDGQHMLAADLLASAQLVDLNILNVHGADQGSDEPPVLAVAALASSTVAVADINPKDRVRGHGLRMLASSGSDIVHGVFNAWAFDGQASRLVNISRQGLVGSGAVLGMHISGKALQLEVATANCILVGSALADAATEADAATQCGVGLPLDIEGYPPANGEFAYPPRVRSALAEQRRRMDSELFIDLLLQMAGVTGSDSSSSAYPPRSHAELRALVEQVGTSDLDDLKQRCIAYYLVLDGGAGSLVSSDGTYEDQGADPTTANGAAAEYARDALVPRHFEYLIRGYWLMDHAQTAAGMPYLADPSVVADWASKILSTAVAGGYYSEALLFISSATALMSPRLDELPSEAPAVMEALLHCGFTRAFEFQRLAAPMPDLRQVLLAQLFSFALAPSSRRSIVSQLAMLPFDGVEEAALAAHCLRPDTSPRARDFLALHYVNCGRYAEAIRLFRAIAKEEEGRYLDGEQRRKRDERLAMVRNLNMLLPEAQRGIVEELEAMDEGRDDGQRITVTDAKCRLAQAADLDPARPRSMDVDDAGYRSNSGRAAPGDLDSVAVSAAAVAPSNVPLTASKSARQLRSVVGAHGAPQSPSHPLLRVLMRQMAVEKPGATQVGAAAVSRDSTVSAAPCSTHPPARAAEAPADDAPATPNPTGDPASSAATPWKTPMSRRASGVHLEASPHDLSSPPSGRRRVPFSGTPSTPRLSAVSSPSSTGARAKPANLIDAGQTPGRGLLAHAVLAETPVAARRVPGGFPRHVGASRSPFEQARRSSTADERSTDETPAGDRQVLGGLDSARRYNLRGRAAQPAGGPMRTSGDSSPSKDGPASLAEDAETMPAEGDSGESAAEAARPASRPQRRAQQKPTQKDGTDHAAASRKSARKYERLQRQPADALPASTRTRKRA
ncbi:hypothetical protein LPJ61_001765 [Coemansia biformis]|uniref:ELYS-like domain-containing protein n=1 Tax=Coemansia biformis TaxID=1286918 RepID=A0A9W7YDP6_9FUNG|nr:hypothetical protein LPJ61_001765 [Coemansia biformis]